MKKVVWIVNEYNFPDAVNTRQTNLCHYLCERGYDAYIISGSAENKGEQNRITGPELYRFVQTNEAKGYIIKTNDYKRSYERVLVALQFQSRLWRLRNELPKPDVIVSDFAGLFGNVFLKWKKKYGTKVIYDILDFWPEGFVDMGYIKRKSLMAKYLYYLEYKSYKNADGIIFSMEGAKDYFIDKGWNIENGGAVDTSKIGYLNNGVNLEVVDKQKNEYILEDADLDSDKFTVIYLGSVSEFNGLDILIEAAKYLKDRNETNIQILVYGYGNREDQLKRMAEDYQLDNIVFKGKLDSRYGMNVLTRGDLNVFTFKETPLLKYGVSPNKLFMYFASAKPVLSMIRPAYDLVEKNKAGISVENNPEIIADTIIKFSKMEKDEYDMYCNNARKLAEEYDYKKLVNVLIDTIEATK